MHCNLRPLESHVSPFLLYLLRYAKFEVAELIHCRIIAFFCWNITLRCDLDFWSLTLNMCRASPVTWENSVRTEFEHNRAIGGGVITISVFDLMTLNIALRVALGFGIIFTKFELRQLAWILAFLCWYVISCCDLDPWPLDHELYSTSAIRVSCV